MVKYMKVYLFSFGLLALLCSCESGSGSQNNQNVRDDSVNTVLTDTVSKTKNEPVDTVKINPVDTIDLASRYPWGMCGKSFWKSKEKYPESVAWKSFREDLIAMGSEYSGYKKYTRIRKLDCGMEVSLRFDECICFRKNKKSKWELMVLGGDGGSDCGTGFKVVGDIVYIIYSDNTNENYVTKYAKYDVFKHELLPLTKSEGRGLFPSGDIWDYSK